MRILQRIRLYLYWMPRKSHSTITGRNEAKNGRRGRRNHQQYSIPLSRVIMRSDDIIIVCGKRRSGKSVWLKDYLKKLERSKIRYIIWDYHWEYEKQNNDTAIIYDPNQILPYFNTSIPFILFRPKSKEIEDFERFCYFCSKLRNIVIVIEEVEKFATSYVMPKSLKEIVDNGRHRGLGLVCTCRRVAKLAGDVPFNVNYIIIFKQRRSQDLEYLADNVGEDIYSLPKLPDYYYLVYDDKTDELTTHEPVTE